MLPLFLLGAGTLVSPSASQAATWPDEVPNFAMLDIGGRYFEFHRTAARVVVLFFTENGCPVARQSLPKLKALREKFAETDAVFWVVDANPSDDRGSIRKEAIELGVATAFPFLRDDTQGVAHLLGVTRTATVVAIAGADGRVIYHGAVDDQLTEGASKSAASEKYLENALSEFLAGQPVKQAVTPARGCLIGYDAKLKDKEISFAREVAPILEKHCLSCHSPGNIGPFSISNYQKVKSKSDMIQEVVLSRRMPPWSADTEFGHFVGERTMTLDETRTLLAWIEQGAQRGEGEDPLPAIKVAEAPVWPLGEPDIVVKLPHPEEIPATGVLEYRHIEVNAPVTEDTWVGAVAVHPGNRKVLHHCIVRVKYPESGDDGSGRGVWLQGWAPGIEASRFPEGTGRLLPKGSTLDLELHYTTTGSAQTDNTEIGIYKLAQPPKLTLGNYGAYNTDFSIPPGDSDAETFAILPVPRQSVLYSMAPHMHLRGSWMRYEVLYPNGKRETLLSVPHYDFNWQTGYRFATPKTLPAGSWILCSGGFDNSAQNPNNPAPAKRIGWGEQSFDEMFIGFVEGAELPGTPQISQSKSLEVK
jgi:peroxiredoxin